MTKEKSVSIITAVGENGITGKDGALPWKMPTDLARFKKITSGGSVIMGRKTHESIGRPLPNRENIVVTRKKDYKAPRCIVVHSLEEALARAKKDVFVIGGEELYREALLHAQRIYLTIVRKSPEGDTSFPFGKDANGKEYGPYYMLPGWTVAYWQEKRKSHEDEFDCIFTEWNRK